MDVMNALASVARYNGHRDILCRIRDYIAREAAAPHKGKFWSIGYPSELFGYMDPDLYPRVIWFVLVEMFGDCGCSPRTGWIDGYNAGAALSFMERLCDESADFN